jgi:hypothetical protein
MDTELLAQILEELRQIRKDLQWFKEREERRQRAVREATEEFAKRVTGGRSRKQQG